MNVCKKTIKLSIQPCILQHKLSSVAMQVDEAIGIITKIVLNYGTSFLTHPVKAMSLQHSKLMLKSYSLFLNLTAQICLPMELSLTQSFKEKRNCIKYNFVDFTDYLHCRMYLIYTHYLQIVLVIFMYCRNTPAGDTSIPSSAKFKSCRKILNLKLVSGRTLLELHCSAEFKVSHWLKERNNSFSLLY